MYAKCFDSLRCIQVIAGVLGRAGEAGQKQRLAAAARGEVTYRPAKGLVMPEEDDDAAAPVERAGTGRKTRDRESLENTEEVATKLDDVNNHESHRVKEGRNIKAVA